MQKVMISPFSRTLRSGAKNPKDYPHWEAVISLLVAMGYHVIQVGAAGEYRFPNVQGFCWGLRLKLIAKALQECATWASVDNFFQHFATYEGKRGVVVFGQQDPYVFGHPANVNLLKGVRYIRPNIWEWWDNAQYREDCWVDAETVANAIDTVAKGG